MILLGIIASLWNQNTAHTLITFNSLKSWLGVHILVMISTYGLLTISAIASFTAAYQEHLLELKKKNIAKTLKSSQNPWTYRFPMFSWLGSRWDYSFQLFHLAFEFAQQKSCILIIKLCQKVGFGSKAWQISQIVPIWSCPDLHRKI